MRSMRELVVLMTLLAIAALGPARARAQVSSGGSVGVGPRPILAPQDALTGRPAPQGVTHPMRPAGG